MNLNILVTGSLYSTQSAYSALKFCRAALNSDHTIKQIFFYQDGVTQANALSVTLSDEFDAVHEWAKLAEWAKQDKGQDIKLVVCVSAGERRGVLNQQQAQEFEKDAANLHSLFSVAGLGVLHEAALASDKMVTFK